MIVLASLMKTMNDEDPEKNEQDPLGDQEPQSEQDPSRTSRYEEKSGTHNQDPERTRRTFVGPQTPKDDLGSTWEISQ